MIGSSVLVVPNYCILTPPLVSLSCMGGLSVLEHLNETAPMLLGPLPVRLVLKAELNCYDLINKTSVPMF